MSEKTQKVVLIREKREVLGLGYKGVLHTSGYHEDTGYEVRFLSALEKFPTEDAGRLVLVLTCWGTRPDSEDGFFSSRSREFCDELIEWGIPFVIITRVPWVVPEEYREKAREVIEKPVGAETVEWVARSLLS